MVSYFSEVSDTTRTTEHTLIERDKVWVTHENKDEFTHIVYHEPIRVTI